MDSHLESQYLLTWPWNKFDLYISQESPPEGNYKRRTTHGISCLSAIHSWRRGYPHPILSWMGTPGKDGVCPPSSLWKDVGTPIYDWDLAAVPPPSARGQTDAYINGESRIIESSDVERFYSKLFCEDQYPVEFGLDNEFNFMTFSTKSTLKIKSQWTDVGFLGNFRLNRHIVRVSSTFETDCFWIIHQNFLKYI